MRKHRLYLSLLLLFAGTQLMLADDIIKVCGQNVQNFFYSLDRSRTQGNSTPISNYNTIEGRSKKAQAIINALAPYEADIYAFNEVETKGEGADGEALDLLAQGMSNKTGKQYLVVSDGLTYDLSSDATGLIKSGFIYRADKVEPVGQNISTAVGYTSIYPNMMRMQTFKSLASGEAFTLSMNHFKASTSGNITEDMEKREQNVIALLKGLNAAGDPDILVMGDLNSEMGEQCLNNLVDAGYEEQIIKYNGAEAYSHWFDDGELIDHVFANSTMAKQISTVQMLNIANPHSTGSKYTAYSDHDPYLVTLSLKEQPAATYTYSKVTSLTAGVPYLMVAPINGLKAAKPVSIDKTYEYQLTTDVTETNGTITMDDAKMAYIFEEAGDGNYYIKDYYGRYVYQYFNTSSNKYGNNTNTGIKSLAQPFNVIPQEDGTFKILNTISNCYYIALTYNSTPEFALYNYSSLRNGQYLPWLYQYNATSNTNAIVNVNTKPHSAITRKVLENGRIRILSPNGHRYSLQGICIER